MKDIILIIACALCGFFLGKFLERQSVRKNDFYRDLTKYLYMLKLNVNSRQIELEKFNVEFCNAASLTFAEFLQKARYPRFLKSNEKNDVKTFIDGLSCTSSAELLKHIEYYVSIFESKSKQLLENESKRSCLFVKLGILLGVMIGILLV